MQKHLSTPPIWDDVLFLRREKGETRKPFELQNVHMIQDNGDPVGLDDISFLLEPSKDVRCQRRMHKKTTVFGITVIPNNSLLSETGEKEVRETFHQLRRAVKYPLELVVCFTSGIHPWYSSTGNDGRLALRMLSEKTKIDYEVKSWDAPCYLKSQNFLERYQIFHCLKFLKEHYNQPAEECTPEWFVDKYREVFREEDAKKRIIFDRTDNEYSATLPDGTAKVRRFLRHLASADIRGRIAEQAEWILANQIASKSQAVQLFNVRAWVGWCEKVKRARVRAKEAGESWGIPPRYALEDLDFPEKDRYGFERFGGTSAIWEKKLSNALKHKPKPKRQDSPMDVDEDSYQLPGSSMPGPVGGPVEFVYDSDFSEQSSSEEEDEGSDDNHGPQKLFDLIPRWLLTEPSFTPGRFKWECPGPGCSFLVDLLRLPEGELNRIPWTHCDDRAVKLYFRQAVLKHYQDHLWDCGFKRVERRGRYHLEHVKEGEARE